MRHMSKKKISVNIDEQTWKEWLMFVIEKHGSRRRVSEETAKALKEYMQRHAKEKKPEESDLKPFYRQG